MRDVPVGPAVHTVTNASAESGLPVRAPEHAVFACQLIATGGRDTYVAPFIQTVLIYAAMPVASGVGHPRRCHALSQKAHSIKVLFAKAARICPRTVSDTFA